MASRPCARYVALALEDYLGTLGVARQMRPGLIKEIINVAVVETDDEVYEERVHNLLVRSTSATSEQTALLKRAERIFRQILHYLHKGQTLDYGCGDGNVGNLIQKYQGQVVLGDTYRHPKVDELELPFFLFPQRGETLLPSDLFDNVILCTVLHHCDDPLFTLAEAVRIVRKGGKILVIESVYGVGAEAISQTPLNTITDAFLSLSIQDQFAANVFFDHFYNRCLHYSRDPGTKVNVPYAYSDPAGWEKIFERHGLCVESFVPLGIDQPLAPLFHTLHVLMKM